MKLMKILVAALVMAAMVSPAIAEDRLKLSGSIQVRGQLDDYNFDSPYAGNNLGAMTFTSGGKKAYLYHNGKAIFTTQDNDDTKAWNDMRLRIGGDLAVAEGVSVHFRFDANESNENSSDPAAWGSASSSSYRYTNRRSDIQFDYAYLKLVKSGFTFMAGEMYFGGFGITRAFHDSTAAGFKASYGGFNIAHSKNTEDSQGNETLYLNGFHGDSNTTAIEYVFKGDNFSLTPIVAYTYDSSFTDRDTLGLGLVGTFNLGPVALKAEVDYFDGSQDTTFGGTKINQDQKGLQVFVDASMPVADSVTLGLQGLWAKDQDKGDGQITSLSTDQVTDWAFVDFNPQALGSGDFGYSDNFDIFDPGKFHGASGAGVTAGGLYAKIKASQDLTLDFLGMAFKTNEDNIADMDGYFLNAMATYQLMANTTLSTQLNYMRINDNGVEGWNVDVDEYDDIYYYWGSADDTTDKAFGVLTSLVVKF
jgi:hypothetical protein